MFAYFIRTFNYDVEFRVSVTVFTAQGDRQAVNSIQVFGGIFLQE